ncbi:MAG: hypothetical protein BYD32DRAFT_182779 [Podila humilis]|nr:MAG: hypothetical protein BYD32DRAFT_182779 [Podila humilis]
MDDIGCSRTAGERTIVVSSERAPLTVVNASGSNYSSSNNPFLNNINHSSPSPPSTSSLEPPGSSKDTKTPLPRPKSTDLPQSLHSYLSTVFDVDWSVGLSTTEDSLFTLHGAGSSSAGAGSSSQTLSGPGAGPLSSSPKRKSLSASSSLSLSLSLSDFMTPSGSGNNTHANGNTKEGTGSSTSTSSSSMSSSSTVSSMSSAVGSSGASSTPLVLAPSGPKHLAPYPYSRSVSDEQINFSSYQNQQQQYTRHGASSASAPTSPSHPPLPPISSSYSGVSVSAASPSGSLTKPLPSYTLNKASKSSPNLVDGGSGSNYYGEPALPLGLDLQYQQQFQQQFFQKSPPSSPSTATGQGEQHKSSSGSGFNKLLSRTSSRRGAGNTTPESYGGQSGATSIGAAMTISSPLSLISSVDQESFHHQHHQYQYQSQPTHKAQDSMSSSPRSYGHGYSQSVGHTFNSGHGSPSSTGASASASGSGGGNRWSSMKTMLGLRVGQTKG